MSGGVLAPRASNPALPVTGHHRPCPAWQACAFGLTNALAYAVAIEVEGPVRRGTLLDVVLGFFPCVVLGLLVGCDPRILRAREGYAYELRLAIEIASVVCLVHCLRHRERTQSGWYRDRARRLRERRVRIVAARVVVPSPAS